MCGYSSDIDRDIEALVISIVVAIPEGVEFARKIEYYIKHYGDSKRARNTVVNGTK